MSAVVDKIRLLCNQKGIPLSRLHDALDIAPDTVKGWFYRGAKPDTASLLRLADIAPGTLAWDFLVWQKIKKSKPMPKIKGWVSRKLLTFVLAAGFAPILPWWIPAGQPSDKILATFANHPGLPAMVSWSAILLVCALLCGKAETRDLLLGRGKALSLVSLGAVVLVLTLTVVGWSLT